MMLRKNAITCTATTIDRYTLRSPPPKKKEKKSEGRHTIAMTHSPMLSDHLPPLPDILQAPPSLHTTCICTHTKNKRDVRVEVGRL